MSWMLIIYTLAASGAWEAQEMPGDHSGFMHCDLSGKALKTQYTAYVCVPKTDVTIPQDIADALLPESEIK